MINSRAIQSFITTGARFAIGLVTCLVLAGTAVAEENLVQSPVTGVVDGDTCFVVLDGTSTRVRLVGIDAPEKRQAFGRRAEQALRNLVGKQTVEVRWSKRDRYGRPLVRLRVGELDVNAELVRQGFAWVYRKGPIDAELSALEAEAREHQRGLWVDPHPIEPSTWRALQRGAMTPSN